MSVAQRLSGALQRWQPTWVSESSRWGTKTATASGQHQVVQPTTVSVATVYRAGFPRWTSCLEVSLATLSSDSPSRTLRGRSSTLRSPDSPQRGVLRRLLSTLTLRCSCPFAPISPYRYFLYVATHQHLVLPFVRVWPEGSATLPSGRLGEADLLQPLGVRGRRRGWDCPLVLVQRFGCCLPPGWRGLLLG